MLERKQTQEVFSDGFEATTQFSIMSSAKMFDILIDKLYSDKIAAVLREYMSNAYDAHVQAGCADRPFEVHLPTQWEPWLSVRDFGVSMTHEMVMSKASSLGWSSKDGSQAASNVAGADDTQAIVPEINTQAKQVGKLGLGMKSGYAYTDSFSLTAYLNGERRMYNCYRDSNRIPVMAHALTEPTDEPQGFEISIPVRIEDISSFAYSYEAMVGGFDVRPVLTGAKLNTKEPTPFAQGTGWKMFTDGNGNQRNLRARQGVVLYEIDTSQIGHEFGILAQEWLVIDFEVGQIDVTPSRESLSYDAETKQNIRIRLQQVMQEYTRIIEERIRNMGSLLKARTWARQNSNTYRTCLNSYAIGQATYRGNKLLNVSHTLKDYQYHSVSDLKKSKTIRFAYTQLYDKTMYFSDDQLFVFDFQDEPVSFPMARLRQLANTRARGGLIHVIRVPSRTSMAFKRALVQIGRPTHVVALSEVELPGLAEKKRRRVEVKARHFYSGTLRNLEHPDSLCNTAAGGYFIYADSRNAEVDEFGKTISLDDASRIIKALRENGEIDSEAKVWLFNKHQRGIPVRQPGWTNIIKIARQFVETHKDQLFDGNAIYEDYDAFKNTTLYRKFSMDFGIWSDSHLISRMIEATKSAPNLDRIKRLTTDIMRVSSLIGVDLNWKRKVELTKYKALVEEMREVYPMLMLVGHQSITRSQAADYVRAMDLLNQRDQDTIWEGTLANEGDFEDARDAVIASSFQNSQQIAA